MSSPSLSATVAPGYFVLATEPTSQPQSKRSSGPQSNIHPDSPRETPKEPQLTNKSDQQAGLLRVPGEIRNHIYGYLFSELLVYRERKTIGALREAQKDSFEDLSLESLRIQDSEQVPETNDSTERKPENEYNQLKYVCRQLYYECSALELEYGELHVSCTETAAAATQFCDLLDFYPSREKWIRKVTLTENAFTLKGTRPKTTPHLAPVENLLTLGRFCQENPRAEVKVIFKDVLVPHASRPDDKEPAGKVKLVYLKKTLRGESCCYLFSREPIIDYEYLPKWALDAARWRKCKGLKDLVAPNLEFQVYEVIASGRLRKKLVNIYSPVLGG